jgi:hypothetical protein
MLIRPKWMNTEMVVSLMEEQKITDKGGTNGLVILKQIH